MDFRLAKIVVGVFSLVAAQGWAVEPIAEREWTSDAGTKLTASAVELRGDVVIFQSADGRQVEVPLARLVEDDQATLRGHFAGEDVQDEPAEGATDEPVKTDKKGKDEFGGEVRDRIPGGDMGHFTAYIPSSLKAEDKRPAFCYSEVRHSDAKTLDRLKAGAEVTGWTVMVHSEMRGEMLEIYEERLGKGFLEAMKNELPVDTERLYAAAYSSGIRGLMQIREHIGDYDGVLAVSGAFGDDDKKLPVCYGMIGLGSASRVNFTKAFEKSAGRGSLIRYTADGRGDASVDDYEDGMIYLAIHHYSDDGARKTDEVNGFVDRLLARAEEVAGSDPERAYMWIKQSEKLRRNAAQQVKWQALLAKLGAMEQCVAYYKGFDLLQDLGSKVIADAGSSVDEKANDKMQRELDRMKEALADTKWIPVIESFSKGD